MPYKDIEKRRQMVYNIRKRNIDHAFQSLGEECWLCEENDKDCLDFHHINPKHKSFRIKNGTTNSLEYLDSELKKCALLCANCHRKVHASIRRH